MPPPPAAPSRRALLATLLGGAATAALPPGGDASAQAASRRAAPGFEGATAWLNTDAPLTLAGLRGKVVLVQFWTYSCINVLRTLPYVRRWQEEYGPAGLQVIGVHAPEFGFEHLAENVEAARRELGLRHPIAQDNGHRIWHAWGNEAWPSFYLLDRNGRLVLVRDGEGHAREMETAIRALLGLQRDSLGQGSGDDADLSHVRTPEIYFGALHPTPQDRAQSPRRGTATYAFGATPPALDAYQLDGTWNRGEEALMLRGPLGGLRLRFSAAQLHVVAGAAGAARIHVRVDGGPARVVEVARPKLYTLVDGRMPGTHLVELEAEGEGLSLFSATFG